MDPIYAVNGTYETFRPMSYVSWRADNLTTADNFSADRTIALIGEAEGGRPGTDYPISTLNQAISIFRAGPLVEAIRLALLTGDAAPPRIRAINVTPGTRSSFTLLNEDNSEFGVLYRNAWRARANQNNLSLTAGTNGAGYNVVLRDVDTGLTLSSNNIGLGVRVQYQGAGTAASLSIVGDASGRSLTTTITGANISESLNIPLVPNMTVAQLCEQINRAGPYNAFPARDGKLPANGLDLVNNVDISQYVSLGAVSAAAAGATTLTLADNATVAAGTGIRVRSTTGNWFVVNTTAATTAAKTLTVTALPLAVAAGTASLAVALPAPALTALRADFTLFFATRGDGAFEFVPGQPGTPAMAQGYFTGGAADTTTFADWLTGLDTVSDKPIAIVVPLTDNQAIVSGFRSQVSALNGPDQARFIQVIAGYDTSRLPAVDATPSDIDAYVREVSSEGSAANSRDSVLVVSTQAFQTAAGNGARERVSLPLMAAHVAGLAAAYGPDNSLTYAQTGGVGAFPKFDRAQTNQLTRAGLLCLETVSEDGAAHIVRDRTTYVGTSNAVYESGFGVRKMNAIARGAKAIQDRTIPGRNGRGQLAKYKADLEDYYERLEERGWIEAGTLSGVDVPAFSLRVFPTGSGGRYVKTLTQVNLVLEFLVGDMDILATTAEFEI